MEKFAWVLIPMLGGAAAFAIFKGLLYEWRLRPRRVPSPTLDSFAERIEGTFARMLGSIADSGSIGIGLAREHEKLLGRILNEVTTSVAEMDLTQERDDHIRSIAEALARPNASVQGVITKLDELQLFIQKQDALKLQAMDALVLEFAKFAKHQTGMFNALFNGGAISTMDEESAAREEKIQALMRRYGLSHEIAEARVRGTAVYEPSTGRTGMRETS